MTAGPADDYAIVPHTELLGDCRVRIVGAEGTLCEILVDLADDVWILKKQVQAETGIPELEQRLSLGAGELHNRDLLSSVMVLGGTAEARLERRSPEAATWLGRLRQDTVQKSRQLCLAEAPAELLSDVDFMFAAVQEHKHSLKFAAPALKAEPSVVRAAVRHSGRALAWAAVELQDDAALALLAVQQDGWALELVSERLQDDLAVVMAAVQRTGAALEFAGPAARADRGVVLEAVRGDGMCLLQAAPELLGDLDLAIAAVSEDWEVLERLPPALRADRRVALAAVRAHHPHAAKDEYGEALAHVAPERTAVENYNSHKGLRFVYKKYALDDSGEKDLLDQLPEALNFVDAARRASPRHNVLVHCARGNSRSIAVVLAYLVQYEGLTLLAAYELLSACRPLAMPHRPFLGRLGLLERELLGRAAPSLGGGEEWARAVFSEEERAAIQIQALVRGRLARARAARLRAPAAAPPPRGRAAEALCRAGARSTGKRSPSPRVSVTAQRRTPSPEAGQRAPSPEGQVFGQGSPLKRGSVLMSKKLSGTVSSPLLGRRSMTAGASPGSGGSRTLKAPKPPSPTRTPERPEASRAGGSGSPVSGDQNNPSDTDSESAASASQAYRTSVQTPEYMASSPSKPQPSSPSRPAPNAEDLAVNRFLACLREKRGTVLRAWLLDLDRRGCGRVSSADLAAACRALGYSKEVKLIWNDLLPKGGSTSLRIHDLDAEEACNLDQLAEALWAEAGLDLDRAWARIDPGNRTSVTAAEFERGLRRLGFQGNAALVFRGLDANGLGHLRRRDFDALERLIPASKRLEGCDNQGVHDLRSWARKMHGGIRMLLTELGLAGGKDCGVLEVGDLAARLVSLGYPRAAAAGTAAAITGGGGYPGGTHVTGNALKSMLVGKPVEAWTPRAARGSSPGAPARGAPRKLWSDSVGNTSLVNSTRSCHTRTYFSTHGSVRWGSPSAASRRAASPGVASAAPPAPAAARTAAAAEAAPVAASPGAVTMTSSAPQPASWLYCNPGDSGSAVDRARVRPGSLPAERAQEPTHTSSRNSMPAFRSPRDRGGPPACAARP